MRDFCREALLRASSGNNRPEHLGRACHGNNPALLPMKTHLIYDFRGVALGLLLGTSFASTKQVVRGIAKGSPALRASMSINTSNISNFSIYSELN